MRSSSDPRARPALDTLESIVDHYIATERTFPKLAYYAQQPSLERALEAVALWRRADRVEGHQRRLSRAAKAGAGERIRKLRLADVRNFDEIHQRVEKAIGSIRGIGSVAVYDVALRIGMYLGKLPRRVTLQAGARAAARMLGLDAKQASLPVDAFPAAFHGLAPWEVEDLLCLYGRELALVARRRAA